MKVVLAREAMECCAKAMEPDTPLPPDTTEEAYEGDIRAIYQAAATIQAQSPPQTARANYTMPIPDWLAAMMQ